MTEIVEGSADEVTDEPQAIAVASTAVARRERRSEVIRPLNAEALAESFTEYQQLLPKLLNDSDYQDAGRGKRFVKKSGWRKIATAFDLDVQIIRSIVERDEHGKPQRAEVWARAIAPSGRMMDGDGYCSIDEDRFSGPRGNQSKLENDLRATATTRAMNRAISGLVGMGEVSAEEVSASDDAGPIWAAPATDTLKRQALDALTEIIGSPALAKQFLNALAQKTDGQLPGIVAAWVSNLPDWIKAGRPQRTLDDDIANGAIATEAA